MKLRTGFLMLIAMLLATATAFPREVTTDFDHHVDFSRYKTYSWAKVDTPNPLWEQRIKEAVDKELQAKGLQEVPQGGDISIMALGITREKQTLRTFYDGFDGWLWNSFGDATTTVDTYKVGTLIIDMFDTSTKKLIWRGTASDVVSDKPEKNVKELEKSVSKMFEHFPPKSNIG